jgi:NADH dehydrogenase FAD-containing subunit
MNPFTKRLVELLPNQYHSKAVEVDSFLRVEGAPQGTVYAMGDAATVGVVACIVALHSTGYPC